MYVVKERFLLFLDGVRHSVQEKRERIFLPANKKLPQPNGCDSFFKANAFAGSILNYRTRDGAV